MGDLKVTSISLLPGFIFYPTEEQLLCYYLSNKNKILYFPSTSATDVSPFGFDLIKEFDFYNYDPLELPEISCFPFGHDGIKKHWYCFTAAEGTECAKREARGGFWKIMEPAQYVVGESEEVILGTKKTFVFFRVDSLAAIKTDWVMYEYALVDHSEAEFVLCRIFHKSHGGNKAWEHVFSSCAEGSVEIMHDIASDVPSKQHAGPSTSVIGVVAHEENIFETENEVASFLMRLINEPDDLVVAGPVFDYGFQLPVGILQPDEMVLHSDGNVSGSAVEDGLLFNPAIPEETFIELNDLGYPLPDIESS
ncbi:hypothetical protein HHK36_008381 [Tetracentron sinense]|uniref:NAC domain-containing protein n=1 Tax=Tetracentron sinense TaxID=13715 RepID=A0A834ZMD5_TETSI|nr:hypothetical protein HHK36_008381 [Tetracentron sinense]